MKKYKAFLCMLFAVILACTVMLAGCAEKDTGDDGGQPQPQEAIAKSITLDGMRTVFAFGEAFSADGLIVTITLSDSTTRAATKSEYTVDSGLYDAQTAGTYTITVKLNDTDISASYTVTVQEPENVPDPTWDDDGALKILAIGNSFSDDMMEYVWQIATDLGVEKVELGNLYIGGCTLDTHANNARDNAAAYEYRTNTDGTWHTVSGYRMGDAIDAQNWDFISLQQASGSSGVASSYARLNELVEYIRSKNDTAQLVWHMTWAYQKDSTHAEFSKYGNDQEEMYEAIINAVDSEVLTNEAFAKFIPNTTSIQNARTSFVGDTLTRDGYHLTYDLGRYIAGLTAVRALTGLSVKNVSFAPANVNEDYRNVAIEAAENAIAEPFAVTPSAYAERPVFDPEGYVLIDPGFTALAYYNSQDSANYDVLIKSAPNSNQFYVTERLTKAQLPVGSVIIVEEGWLYRPEGWTSNAPQATRPGLVSINRVDVTEEWWGDYIYRAFNLAKSGNPSLKGEDEATVKSALKLYVPEDLYVAPTEPDLQNDYELVDLELTGGFYDSTNKTNFDTPITDNAYLSAKFFASKTRFTKDTLPVGSVIVLEAGWQYRPEAWTSDTKQTSRPGNTAAQITIVTEEWWHGLQYRAFNLSKPGLPVLTGQENEAKEALKIYIPKNLHS